MEPKRRLSASYVAFRVRTSDYRVPATEDSFQTGQTAKARRGLPCAVTPLKRTRSPELSDNELQCNHRKPLDIEKSVKASIFTSAINGGHSWLGMSGFIDFRAAR
jgi:hypothetical protein